MTLLAPRLGGSFRYALTPYSQLIQEAEVLYNVLGGVHVLVNSLTKASAHLFQPIALTASLIANYDSQPAPGKVRTNTALIVGVEIPIS